MLFDKSVECTDSSDPKLTKSSFGTNEWKIQKHNQSLCKKESKEGIEKSQKKMKMMWNSDDDLKTYKIAENLS